MAKTGLLPSLDRLLEVFEYDAEAGTMVWRKKPHPKAHAVVIGAPVGHLNDRGYVNVMLDKKPYAVHRVAWKMHHGEEPPEFLDHENGNPWDFKIKNLREASQSQNNANRDVMGNSCSRIKGIKHYNKGAYNCWIASYTENGRKKAKTFPFTEAGLDSAVSWRNEQCARVYGAYDRPSEA